MESRAEWSGLRDVKRSRRAGQTRRRIDRKRMSKGVPFSPTAGKDPTESRSREEGRISVHVMEGEVPVTGKAWWASGQECVAGTPHILMDRKRRKGNVDVYLAFSFPLSYSVRDSCPWKSTTQLNFFGHVLKDMSRGECTRWLQIQSPRWRLYHSTDTRGSFKAEKTKEDEEIREQPTMGTENPFLPFKGFLKNSSLIYYILTSSTSLLSFQSLPLPFPPDPLFLLFPSEEGRSPRDINQSWHVKLQYE